MESEEVGMALQRLPDMFRRCGMTDQDKQTLSERIATLAEIAGINGELLWSQDTAHCPDGHVGKAGWKACLHEISRPGFTIACAKPLHADARDMTDPAVLIPVIEAWIAPMPHYRYLRSEWSIELCSWVAIVNGAPYYFGSESDLDRTIAEARALCTALEVEKKD